MQYVRTTICDLRTNKMETENFDQYRDYITTRLDALTPIFAKAAVGDFESNIDIPDADDKFTELYVGIQVMLEVIREKTHELKTFNKQLEERVLRQTEELRKQNTLLATILRSIGDGIVVTDLNADPILMNPTAERLLGKSLIPHKPGALGTLTGAFLPDKKTPFPEAERPIIRALAGEASDGVEAYIQNEAVPRGMYVSSSGHPLRDEHNKLFGAVAVFRDISVHKQLEEELALYTKELEEKVRERTTELEQYLAVLHQEEAKEKALLESIGDGVIAVDKDRKVIYVNQATEQMLGTEDMVGKPFLEAVPAQDEKGNTIPSSERLITHAAQTGKSMSQTYYYVRHDGTRFLAAVTASPIMLNGVMTGLVNTFRDITKEREIERAKDELVSLVSHQLRTPPTGIKWYAGMLLEEEVGTINDMQRAYLREINYNNERMIDVVNALLSVSRIELGTFVVEPKLTDVTKLVEGVISEVILHAEEKHLEIVRKYPPEPHPIMIDPTLVRMIVQNLIFNAVKYTAENGKITVGYEVVGPEFHMSVEDTGCGIPREDQKNIFTKLFRADNARKIDSSGTGLGLYIVKRIINEMGGHIHFTSEENKGTVFVIAVPIVPSI